MPQAAGGGMFSGLMGSLVTGAAMGTGSAIAHRAVDSMMGPRGGSEAAAPAPPQQQQQQYQPQQQSNGEACGSHVKSFSECMSRNNGDMSSCQFYFDSMQQCKMGNA
ncbi:MAG: hypothetical protein WDW36_007754 [Sanguina aurantia]